MHLAHDFELLNSIWIGVYRPKFYRIVFLFNYSFWRISHFLMQNQTIYPLFLCKILIFIIMIWQTIKQMFSMRIVDIIIITI